MYNTKNGVRHADAVSGVAEASNNNHYSGSEGLPYQNLSDVNFTLTYDNIQMICDSIRI